MTLLLFSICLIQPPLLYEVQVDDTLLGYRPVTLTESGSALAVRSFESNLAAVIHKGSIERFDCGRSGLDSGFSFLDDAGRLYGFDRSDVLDFQGWIWKEGRSEKLPGLSFPVAHGSVDTVLVGAKGLERGDRAAVYQGGKTTLLPLPQGLTLTNDIALDSVVIATGAASKRIVGYGHFGDEERRAVLPLLWTDESATTLPLPKGAHHGVAKGINNLGCVVGQVCDISIGNNVIGVAANWLNPKPEWRATLWQDGKVTALAPPERSRIAAAVSWGSYANDINDSGLIVGRLLLQVAEGKFESHAVLWAGSRMILLSSLLAGPLEYELHEAININNRGEILCVGIKSIGEFRSQRIPVILRPLQSNGGNR